MLPMILSGNINYYLMTFMLVIFASDTATKFILNKCMSTSSLVVSLITSAIIGSASAFGIYNINPELTFFSNTTTNNVTCNKKSNKKFVCSVYKNGQLVKNI